MRVHVMGAGAIGSFYGGLIARAGHDVTFITRGRNFRHLKDHGIVVKSVNSDFAVRDVNVKDRMDGLKPADCVLFTVKSYDTDEAAEQMLPVLGDRTAILTLQNGIDNCERIAAVIGPERVLPGFTIVGVSIDEAGIVQHKNKGEIYFGEWDGQESERTHALHHMFDDAGIPNFRPRDIRTRLWKKFLWNCIVNIPAAICNLPFNRMHECTESAEMLNRLIAEVVTVGRAEGVSLSGADTAEVLGSAKSFGEYISSTLNDIRKRKKKLEFESFVGAVVRMAEKHAISVPVNATLYSLMKAIESDIRKS